MTTAEDLFAVQPMVWAPAPTEQPEDHDYDWNCGCESCIDAGRELEYASHLYETQQGGR